MRVRAVLSHRATPVRGRLSPDRCAVHAQPVRRKLTACPGDAAGSVRERFPLRIIIEPGELAQHRKCPVARVQRRGPTDGPRSGSQQPACCNGRAVTGQHRGGEAPAVAGRRAPAAQQRPRRHQVGVGRGSGIKHPAPRVGVERQQPVGPLKMGTGPGPHPVKRRQVTGAQGERQRVGLPFADGVAPLVEAGDPTVRLHIPGEPPLARPGRTRRRRGGPATRKENCTQQRQRTSPSSANAGNNPGPVPGGQQATPIAEHGGCRVAHNHGEPARCAAAKRSSRLPGPGRPGGWSTTSSSSAVLPPLAAPQGRRSDVTGCVQWVPGQPAQRRLHQHAAQVGQGCGVLRHRLHPPGLTPAVADDQTARYWQMAFHPGSGHDLERGTDSSVGDQAGGVLRGGLPPIPLA